MNDLDRRLFVKRSIGTVVLLGLARPLLAQTAPASAGPADPKLVEDLVAANRILVDQGVLDGYGHVSVRHDRDPNRYLMARSVAPELVTATDIMEYDLDSNPVNADGRTTYLERFIHGEIYKARPDVNAVVHCHSPSLIPFGVTAVTLRPLYHMSAFLVGGAHAFDEGADRIVMRVAGPVVDNRFLLNAFFGDCDREMDYAIFRFSGWGGEHANFQCV